MGQNECQCVIMIVCFSKQVNLHATGGSQKTLTALGKYVRLLEILGIAFQQKESNEIQFHLPTVSY